MTDTNAYTINECIDKFLARNNFSLQEVTLNDDMQNTISRYINIIIKNYGVTDEVKLPKKVCVRDIVGFEPCSDLFNLLSILRKMYDEDSTETYSKRDVEQLDLSKDKMIERIKQTALKDEIRLDLVDDGKYVVSINGCHRTSLLRLMYLLESKGKSEEEQSIIDEKYTIDCFAKTYDYDVTYIYFILSYIGIIDQLYQDCDEHLNYNKTYIVKDYEGNRKIYTREELINYFLTIVNQEEFLNNNYAIQMLVINAKKYQSLREFLEKYVPTLTLLIKEEEKNETSRN